MPGLGWFADTKTFHDEMFQGGRKTVEDKRDCYGYLDNVEGFSREDADKSGNCTIWHNEDEEEKQMTLVLRGCLSIETNTRPRYRAWGGVCLAPREKCARLLPERRRTISWRFCPDYFAPPFVAQCSSALETNWSVVCFQGLISLRSFVTEVCLLPDGIFQPPC
jgi:hypothetical protein